HRVFDAVFRDSTLDGVLFRKHPIGESFERSTPKDAGALFHYSPTTLLFGAWDSTGKLGGLGTKFERLIESEVVAFGVADGVTVGGRLDPLLINTSAVVYEADNEMGWTTDESEATRDKKGNPKKFPKAKGESTSS